MGRDLLYWVGAAVCGLGNGGAEDLDSAAQVLCGRGARHAPLRRTTRLSTGLLRRRGYGLGHEAWAHLAGLCLFQVDHLLVRRLSPCEVVIERRRSARETTGNDARSNLRDVPLQQFGACCHDVLYDGFLGVFR